jgi:hypothetical protein
MGKPDNYPDISTSSMMDKKIPLADKVVEASCFITKVLTLNNPTCISRCNRTYNVTDCTCLFDSFASIAEESKLDFINCIALYVVIFISSGRQNQGILFSTFVNYARGYDEVDNEGSYRFILPMLRDNTNAVFNGDIPKFSICRYALQWILNIRPDKWKGLITDALQNRLYNHHLCNKPANNRLSDDVKVSMSKFFISMTALSCPRATRTVRSITGLEELRDRDDEVNELPSNLTQRRLYRRWLWSRGHTTEIDSVGRMLFSIRSPEDIAENSEWDLDGLSMPTIPLAICAWPTFFISGSETFQNLFFHHHEKTYVILASPMYTRFGQTRGLYHQRILLTKKMSNIIPLLTKSAKLLMKM